MRLENDIDWANLEISAKLLGGYPKGQRNFFNFWMFGLNIKQRFTHIIDEALFVLFLYVENHDVNH